MSSCATPLSLERLAAYRLGELDAAEEAATEDHYFGCTSCAERLGWLTRLGLGVTAVMAAGRVSASVTGTVVTQLQETGANIRTYRLAPGQTVACTASPTDHFIAVRLAFEAADDETVDLTSVIQLAGATDSMTQSRVDVPVDRVGKEAVFLFSGDGIRAVPRSVWTIFADVHGPRGDRRVGPFVLDHTPWDELPPGSRPAT